MTFEGFDYQPWRDGKFRCPHKCSDPNYPQRTWSSEKGFAKHLAECKGKPEPVLEWVAPPKTARIKHSDCPDCGGPIWEMSSCWWMRDRIVCLECYRPYFDAGKGHLEPAGWNPPGMALEG